MQFKLRGGHVVLDIHLCRFAPNRFKSISRLQGVLPMGNRLGI
jgi:hypothetical protein